MNQDNYNLDTNESVFFTRQLETIKAKSYDVKQKALKATSLIPVSSDAASGAETITYRQFTQVGLAKIMSDYANDFPRADAYGTETSVKVKSIGVSYGYSIQEIRASQMAGANLDVKRAQAAKRAMDQELESIAWSGNTNHNISGLIAYPGITEYTVPNDGTGTTKTWSTKTPDQIVRDLSGLVNAVTNTTNGIEIPDTILMDLTHWSLITNTRMGDGSNETIYSFFLKTNPYIKQIEWLQQLTTAGTGSTSRIMAYAKDPEHLTLEIPQPFEQFAADKKGMEFEIPCHMRTAGVIVYYPLSVAYGDGI